MARATYQFCVHRKMTLFGFIPDKHEESNVDEILSYIFAGFGCYFQLHQSPLPIPLNLMLWPFEIAEYYIKWTITTHK